MPLRWRQEALGVHCGERFGMGTTKPVTTVGEAIELECWGSP